MVGMQPEPWYITKMKSITYKYDFIFGNTWLSGEEEVWKGSSILPGMVMFYESFAGNTDCFCLSICVFSSSFISFSAVHTIYT